MPHSVVQSHFLYMISSTIKLNRKFNTDTRSRKFINASEMNEAITIRCKTQPAILVADALVTSKLSFI